MARVVVISDTHDFFPTYVLENLLLFRPDIVLHNGDLERSETYDLYAGLGVEFHAVKGDKDASLDLKTTNIVIASGICIGQIHGERTKLHERASTLVNGLARGRFYYWNNFAQDALAQFSQPLDILTTGHLHIPFNRQVNHTSVLNPGAIVVNDRSHHLKFPTLSLIEIRGSSFEIMFFALKERSFPIPLEVGSVGPVRGLRCRPIPTRFWHIPHSPISRSGFFDAYTSETALN